MILAYHSISHREWDLAVDPQAFGEHLDRLTRFEIITAREYAARFRRGDRLTSSVALTFDDAYRDFYETALPMLSERGMTATLFVPARLIGSTLALSARGGERSAWPIMDVEELRACSEHGIEVGAHSATHPMLPALDDLALREEIEGSKQDLEEIIGMPVAGFCYPAGAYDGRALSLTAASYEYAVVTPTKPFHRSSAHALKRVGVYRHDSLHRFRLKLSRPGAFALEAARLGRSLAHSHRRVSAAPGPEDA